ncbi:MAG TPA: CotH kinase family protein [Polyangiaceae bacterium]|nr:CotH kinase family protein [Polyangiaceae bacterium]
MSPRELFPGASLAALLLLAACGGEPVDPSGDRGGGGGVGGKADSVSQRKAEFFASDDVYVIDIRGWGRAEPPGAHAKSTSVTGAKLGVYAAPASQTEACPTTLKKKDRLHSTDAFSLARSEDAEANASKVSLAIEFTDPAARMFDMRALALSAMGSDPSQLREALALEVFARAKVPAPRQAYAKLCIDGEYQGLFSIVENIDKGFLQEHYGKNDEGSLYRGRDEDNDLGPADLSYRAPGAGQSPGAAYTKGGDLEARSYRLESNTGESSPNQWQSYDDLALFIRTLHGVDIPGGDERFNTDAYRESVESIFDVRTFLRWAGVNSLVGGWSNYWGSAANYYLYNSGRGGDEAGFMQQPYFHFIPWNYVRSLGTDAFSADWAHAHVSKWEDATLSVHGGQGKTALPLVTLLLKNDSFQSYYLDHLRYLLKKRFTLAEFEQSIDDGRGGGLWARIETAVAQEASADDALPSTGRAFTTRAITEHVFQGRAVEQGGMRSVSVLDFVNERRGAVQEQLNALESSFPAGDSQGDFPEGPRALPEELSDTFECPWFDQPVSEGKLDAATLSEASGMAVSRKHPGVVWMHNDSGSDAELFAVGVDGGKDLGQFSLAGATAIDWEDLAMGPGPELGQQYLYVADTGDVDGQRKKITVYRVAEPDTLLGSQELNGVEALAFQYPDGKSYDAETLLVDPLSADLYVVSKNPSGKSHVFRAAAPHTTTLRTLERVATLDFGASPLSGSTKVTGGDIAPHGELVVLRTLDRAYAFRRIPGREMGDAFSETPCKLPLHKEPQGEAFAFAPDGLGYFTVSEGSGENLYSYARFLTVL